MATARTNLRCVRDSDKLGTHGYHLETENFRVFTWLKRLKAGIKHANEGFRHCICYTPSTANNSSINIFGTFVTYTTRKSGSSSPACGCRNGLQMWRISANILNKQSRKADKEWSSRLGVWRGATTPHCKALTMSGISHKSLGIGLVKGSCECGDEPT